MSLLTHKQHVESLTWEPWGAHIIAKGRHSQFVIADEGKGPGTHRGRYRYAIYKMPRGRPFASYGPENKIGNYKAVWEAQYAAERFENEPRPAGGESARATRGARSAADRLFIGVFPAGISYADRSREKHGDYAKCAFLSYDTLELKIESDCPRELRPLIERDAAKIQARRGEQYQVSSSGQTVLLGGGARATRSPRSSSFKVIHGPDEAFTYVNRLGFAPSGPIGYRQHDLGVVVDKLLEASGQTTWYHKEFRPFKVRFQNYVAEGTGYRYPWLGQFIVIGPDEQVRVLEMKGVKTH